MSHARVPGSVSAAGRVADVPAAPCRVSPLLHLHRQEEPVRQLRRPRHGDGLPQRLLPHQTLRHARTRYQIFFLIKIFFSYQIFSDEKFRETSGNRSDTNLKNVLLSTFSGMFDNIPMLAVAKAAEMIAEKPVKDDLGALNDEVFSSMNQDCGELGCQFASVMETNISRLEDIFDTIYVSKINKNTLSSAVISSFNNLDTQIPANGTMESPLNITLETVKDDIGKMEND